MAISWKASGTRRQKVRQLRAETTESFWRRLAHRVGPWPIAVGILFLAGMTATALHGRESLQYTIGQKIDQPIVARVRFVQEDAAQTEKKREAARADTPSGYRIDFDLIERICSEVTNLYQEARAAESVERFREVAARHHWVADEVVYHQLHELTQDEDIERYKEWVAALRESLTREYTIRPPSESDRTPPARASHIMVTVEKPESVSASPAEPSRVDGENVVRITETKAVAGRAGVLARAFPYQMHAVRATVEAILTRMLQESPILVYDQARTLEAMNQAARSVEPVRVTYEKGSPVVFRSKGEQAALTREELAVLELEQKAFQDFMNTGDPEAMKLRKQQFLARAGLTVVFALLSVALFGYVGLHHPRILKVRTRTVALAAMLLAMLVGVRFCKMVPALSHAAPVPVLLATSVLSLAYDRRFAVGVMAVAVLAGVLTVRGDVGLYATWIGGVTVVAFMLEDVRSRTQIIFAGLASGAVMFVTAFAFALMARQELAFSARTAGGAGLAALASALLFQAVLPFIERAFRIATSLTLSEWRDANKPLLQLLVQKAPGTYNHSLVLGAMAQAACEAIGANGLLAQVGALYHDIGKIHQPEYFAENQHATISRHAKLEPRMSLLVILSHVKNGLALANEYGLPRVLHQFIAEHHGTTVVRYFHHTASERQQKIASGKHDREVSEFEFRYEGPKPRSRETVVLMLCDSAEGAVRALPEPTAGRIESTVHAVLMDRLEDGQFDGCDITLRELYAVEESLVKSLCGFYHGRVAYPKTTPKPEPAPEEPADDTEPHQPAVAG